MTSRHKWTSKMPKNIKTAWVKALRSGKYRQATGALEQMHDGEKFNCCLGVLCRVAKIKSRGLENGRKAFGKSGDSSCGSLPSYVMDRFGISCDDEDKLIAYNDDKGYGFKRIASIIDARM